MKAARWLKHMVLGPPSGRGSWTQQLSLWLLMSACAAGRAPSRQRRVMNDITFGDSETTEGCLINQRLDAARPLVEETSGSGHVGYLPSSELTLNPGVKTQDENRQREARLQSSDHCWLIKSN